MKKEKKVQKNELEELRTLTKRIQADFENYRKRTQKEKEQFAEFMNTDLILQIIPTLDHFKLALKHLPKELEGNGWVEGIWHIEKQLENTLSDSGLVEIKTIGERFDHELHEAIEEIESKKPPGEIIEEVQKGYKLKDKVIRPARVKVAK